MKQSRELETVKIACKLGTTLAYLATEAVSEAMDYVQGLAGIDKQESDITLAVKNKRCYALFFRFGNKVAECFIISVCNRKCSLCKFLASGCKFCNSVRSNCIRKFPQIYISQHNPSTLNKAFQNSVHKPDGHTSIFRKHTLTCQRFFFQGFCYAL